MFFFEFLLLSMPLLCFWSLRIYQLLSQHITIVTAKLNKTSEQIRNEKSILKAILIQTMIPVICTLPCIFFFFMIILQGWDSTAANLTIFSYGKNHEHQYTTIYLCFLIAVTFPILVPFITLRVVQSYHKSVGQLYFLYSSAKTQPIELKFGLYIVGIMNFLALQLHRNFVEGMKTSMKDRN